MKKLRSLFSQLSTVDAALIVVIAIGYVVGIATYWSQLNLAEILVTFVMTAVYLGLARGADYFFHRFPSGWAKAGYFTTQLLLSTLVINILGPGAWLISLPLAAIAVEALSKWWQRWIVYIAIFLSLIMPYLLAGRYEDGFYFALTMVPAIVFVVVFSNLVRSEHQAREEAEALAAQLEEANRQLVEYSTQVDELARTRERNRLAREIHDSLGHYLTVVNVQIRAAQAIMATDPQKAQEALNNAQRLTQEGLDAVRQSVAALRESPLGGRSLQEAIGVLVNEARAGGLVVDATVRGDLVRLDPKVELTLFRAVQEGLTNVRKHARASRVDLILERNHASRVSLIITDNGVGMTPNGAAGYGLLGIKERVDLLGGQMDITSEPGAGFTLSLTLPLNQPQRASATADMENA